MLTSAARKYLSNLNKSLVVESSNYQISEREFEKVIDVFEKLRVVRNSRSLKAMCDGFYTRMQHYPELVQRVPRNVLERIYKDFWLTE